MKLIKRMFSSLVSVLSLPLLTHNFSIRALEIEHIPDKLLQKDMICSQSVDVTFRPTSLMVGAGGTLAAGSMLAYNIHNLTGYTCSRPTPQCCSGGLAPLAYDFTTNILSSKIPNAQTTSENIAASIVPNPSENRMITAIATQVNGSLNDMVLHASNVLSYLAEQAVSSSHQAKPTDSIAANNPTVDVRAYGATANYSADDGPAIQSAVNAAPNNATVLLGNNVINTQVKIPATKNITFQSWGPVSITSPIGFKRDTLGSSNTNPYRLIFQGITFNKKNAGTVIQDFQQFSSSGNVGVSLVDDTFNLDSGAIGWQTEGADFNHLFDDHFNSSDGTMIAIQPYANVPGSTPTVNSSQVTTVTGCTFVAGHALVPILLSAAADSWEGWMFSGNHFFAATVDVNHANSVNFTGNEFNTAHVIVENSVDEFFEGNYFDTNDNRDTLLTIEASIHVQVLGNQFNFQGRTGVTGVLFINGGSQTSTTITLIGNNYVGANNLGDGTGGYGIYFADPTLRNVYVGGENFRQLSGGLFFKARLDRSTIDRFEARDVFYYAQNLPANAGQFLRADYLYKVFPMHLVGYLPSTVTENTEISSTNVVYPEMFTPPVITLSRSGQKCSKGLTALAGDSFQGEFHISLLATTAAPTGFGSCDITVTLDGTLYVAPR